MTARTQNVTPASARTGSLAPPVNGSPQSVRGARRQRGLVERGPANPRTDSLQPVDRASMRAGDPCAQIGPRAGGVPSATTGRALHGAARMLRPALLAWWWTLRSRIDGERVLVRCVLQRLAWRLEIVGRVTLRAYSDMERHRAIRWRSRMVLLALSAQYAWQATGDPGVNTSATVGARASASTGPPSCVCCRCVELGGAR